MKFADVFCVVYCYLVKKRIETPKNFNFERTLKSHGWYSLSPFEFNEENWTLSYVFDTEKPIYATVLVTNKDIEIDSCDDKIISDFRRILRIDEDFSEFYELLRIEKNFMWIEKQKTGRLLRSPTVWEDLVKTICTTNCNWSMTESMVSNLVQKLGKISTCGKRAFPTAESMANMSVDFYKNEIRAGYRSLYFKELADKVASGTLNPETWFESDLPTSELKKEFKKVKGVGNYAAENLLKLVGRYDGLALDSWLRSQFSKKYNNGNACDDKQIEMFYDRFGKWRGLVIWLDMTESWHQINGKT
jgi:3-methyladenine DNA glycosylase/8-oxoguanine DNA glycosylase